MTRTPGPALAERQPVLPDGRPAPTERPVVRRPETRPATGPAALVAAIPAAVPFGGAIGLAAFLLFAVEPLIGRLALPVFGGAAGVWATVLAFFQAALLLGYLYAHVVATRLSVRSGAMVHVVVVLVAIALTVLAPARLDALRDERLPTIVDLVRVLAITIGPAAIAVTATTPLVSSWFARVRRASAPDAPAADPYWLYALSNGGSLVALLAYPFVFEPNLGLGAQRGWWLAGIGVFAAFLALAALRVAVTPGARSGSGAGVDPGGPSDAAPTTDAAPATDVAPVTHVALPIDAAAAPARTRERLTWLSLAAIPSGLLSAVTNLITTDLISAPLLWVVPLAIYLGTFIVAFSARGRTAMPLVERLAPAAATLLWVPLGSSAGWPVLPLLAIEYLGLAIVATTLHGRLAARRPASARLTEFYLLLSAGGVVGGAFVAVVAPLAFDGIWEYPLLVAAALVALAWTRVRPPRAARTADGAALVPQRRRRPLAGFVTGAPTRVGPYLLVAAALVAVMAAGDALAFEAAARWLLVGAVILLFGAPPGFLAVTTTFVLVLATFILPPPVEFRDRSFFGVTEVLRQAETRVLMHGTTVHGSQWLDPARRDDPGSYYARSGPVGDLFALWEGRGDGGGSIVVTGLGAGTLAAYAGPGDDLTFFEIDEVVARVAADPAYFTYLRDTRASTDVRIGDGRLLLAAEPAASHDMAILDAFSSDSIPTHLITLEAMADAMRTLRPDGVLAVHVSNRYYDFAPAVAAGARDLGLAVLERQYTPSEAQARAGAGPSHWLILARSPSSIEPLRERGWLDARMGTQPLTDDFADLLRYLRPGTF